jgi:hypothetical protein
MLTSAAFDVHGTGIATLHAAVDTTPVLQQHAESLRQGKN